MRPSRLALEGAELASFARPAVAIAIDFVAIVVLFLCFVLPLATDTRSISLTLTVCVSSASHILEKAGACFQQGSAIPQCALHRVPQAYAFVGQRKRCECW